MSRLCFGETSGPHCRGGNAARQVGHLRGEIGGPSSVGRSSPGPLEAEERAEGAPKNDEHDFWYPKRSPKW